MHQIDAGGKRISTNVATNKKIAKTFEFNAYFVIFDPQKNE